MRTVTIWSEGTRIAGDLYHPPDFDPDRPRPAILLCHGWGGRKAGLTRHASAFAAAGYVALAIDYRGWGESESKVVVLQDLPRERTEATARVQVIREVVDPFDELWDIRHALDWLEGEPGVDTSRLGLWGSSFGGGLVVWMAAHDERVQCVVSQVAWHDARGLESAEGRAELRRLATRIARGETEPVPQAAPEGQGLAGVGHRTKFYYWAPVEHAEKITAPVLLIDAEHEELFDRHASSERVYERMTAAGRAAVRYHVVPRISHYHIYNDAFQQSVDLAIAWYDEHLRGI
jgi:dipeptidyl aminopeptidase/acylaminoacyl peptidase